MRRDATTRQGEGEAERFANLFVARCLIEDAVFPLTRRFRPRTFVPRNGLEQKLGYRDKTRPRLSPHTKRISPSSLFRTV